MARTDQLVSNILNYPKPRYSASRARGQQTNNDNSLNAILKVVADEDHFDLKQASDLTKAATLQDPDLERKLIKFAKQGKASADEVIRIIRIFECVCSKSELLAHLLQLDNLDQPRIRSKVVLTIGRLVQNAGWLREQLQDSNARVRANAIEALWEVQVDGAENLFLRAILDSNNRVIGNAAFGLYKLGNSRAIPVLHSLLRHSDKLFRTTGLWVITQLGDPRFLEYLQAPPAGRTEEEEETKRRETARQHLAARLRSSQFAGRIVLDLTSFKVVGNKTRIAGLSCLSSDPGIYFVRPELGPVNFVIEEGHGQIEEFECRWIDPVEPISAAVIVPANLSLRSQPLRVLAEKAALSEAVAISRYLPSVPLVKDSRSWPVENQAIGVTNSPGSQSFSVSNNLYEAILKGLERLHSSSGPRHLLLVIDRSAEGKLPANIQKLIRISNTTVHALAADDAGEELIQTIKMLSLKSGGTFLRSDSAEALPALVSSIQARHASSCELSWSGFEKTPTEVKIRCISRCGYGEVAIAGQAK